MRKKLFNQFWPDKHFGFGPPNQGGSDDFVAIRRWVGSRVQNANQPSHRGRDENGVVATAVGVDQIAPVTVARVHDVLFIHLMSQFYQELLIKYTVL